MHRAAPVMLVVFVVLTGTVGCNDVRDFAGLWSGNRVGNQPVLRVGEAEMASLRIDAIDKHGLRGVLIVNTFDDAPPIVDASFSSLEAAEADVLANMTFAGDPLRVYLAFVPLASEPAGSALAIVSLYDSQHIELRLIKGEPDPLYAIFPLTQSE